MLRKTFEIFISDTLLPFSLSLFSPLALLFLLLVYFFGLLLDYSVKTALRIPIPRLGSHFKKQNSDSHRGGKAEEKEQDQKKRRKATEQDYRNRMQAHWQCMMALD